MVLVRKWPFLQLFFLGNIREENVFYVMLEQKSVFLGHKNKKFKKSKNWQFSKRLTYGFGPKMAIFPLFFFLTNIGQENVFYVILEWKNAFLAIKTRSSKSRKIDIFPNGLTHGLGTKMAIFPTFFF